MTPRPRNATFAMNLLLDRGLVPPNARVRAPMCPLASPRQPRRPGLLRLTCNDYVTQSPRGDIVTTREEVLERLAQVQAPDGRPLPATGTLSDVVVSDGKVFFSLTVDAAAVPAWEPVRKAAEAAVRSVPGVTSALVALTAERAGGAGRTSPARSAVSAT